jgi:hypothetical protein
MNPTSRRTLLKHRSIIFAPMTLLTTLSRRVFAESLAKATGIQLYTLGKELNEHLDGTLTAIAAMGCRSVESAGMAGKSAAEFRKALDTAGLKCPSSHLLRNPARLLKNIWTR